MLEFLKRLKTRMLCTHKIDEIELVSWLWLHGHLGYDPRYIEALWKCKKCGKKFYIYPEQGSDDEKWYTETQLDKKL